MGGSHQHTGVVEGRGGVEFLSANVNSQLNELRRFVAPFHNFDKAVAYGYSVPAPQPGVCISHPTRGGMGFHYTLRRDLINDGRVELLEPEFLVYAPKPNGGVKFAALDYFVPYNTWTRQNHPRYSGGPSLERMISRRTSCTSGCSGTIPLGCSRTTTLRYRCADESSDRCTLCP
jgi:hypothetical protein